MSKAENIFLSATAFYRVSAHTIDLLFNEPSQSTHQHPPIEKCATLLLDAEDESSEWGKVLPSLQASQYEEHPEMVIPFIVNATFACELFMKSILTFLNKPYPTRGREGHDLTRLFPLLPPEMQNTIISSVAHSYFGNFQDELKNIQLAFDGLRYWFEKHPQHVSLLFLNAFCDSLYEQATQSLAVTNTDPQKNQS